MTRIQAFLVASVAAASATAAPAVITGPDGRLTVNVDTDVDGRPVYSVAYDGVAVINPSALGFTSDVADFSRGFTLADTKAAPVKRSYVQDRIKRSHIDVEANTAVTTFRGADGHEFAVEWFVKDNDIAFRYLIPRQGKKGVTGAMVVTSEATSYRFPETTTTFLTPQSDAMIGWKRTKPSYEEFYTVDAPMDTASQYGHGYTFPALFRTGGDASYWVLLTESGVDGYYCGSHLSDYTDGAYTIAYPMPEENNGNGSAAPGIALPGRTPWRTITVAPTLAPIVETTIPWDVTEPLYTTATPARPGRGTWSWIIWQDDNSCYENQVAFIDLAEAMGYEHVLVDAGWDTNIGRDGVKRLVDYARSKGIDIALWYSSSGHWNDIVQSPINHMDRPIVRKREMQWLRDLGVHTIKVDFFGGDKQETMRLYEDILSDAADYGIDVIFHGCTMPRGWERMYPNYVGSEAVLASENLVFGQKFCDLEAFSATLHPFIRNSVGVMEFGGTVLNRRLNRGNNGGTVRRTGDAFQLATAVLYQNPVQNFALTPGNLTDAPEAALDFMRRVPTTWDDVRFIDGYPGRYVVLARRSGDAWYIAGVNAGAETRRMQLDLTPYLDGGMKSAVIYLDRSPETLEARPLQGKKPEKTVVDVPSQCGFVIVVK